MSLVLLCLVGCLIPPIKYGPRLPVAVVSPPTHFAQALVTPPPTAVAGKLPIRTWKHLYLEL